MPPQICAQPIQRCHQWVIAQHIGVGNHILVLQGETLLHLLAWGDWGWAPHGGCVRSHLSQALQKLVCLQGCCRAGAWGSEICAAKISSAGGSWNSWVCSFSLLPCLGRSQMPPQDACAMAVPGCLLQQAGEEGEIKGGFQHTVPFCCPEVSLVLPAGQSHISSALSHGFNSKLLLAQHHLALDLVSL